MWEREGEGERQWCGGCSRMNERGQEKDHKRESQRISHPEAGKASRLAPNGKIQPAWKELRQLRFSQTSGRLSERRSRQSPAMWCWKNARKQWETENRRLPASFGKVETRKSGNSCKKKKKGKISYVQKYGLKVQVQCREEIWKEAETLRRKTDTYFVNCYHYQYSPSAPWTLLYVIRDGFLATSISLTVIAVFSRTT